MSIMTLEEEAAFVIDDVFCDLTDVNLVNLILFDFFNNFHIDMKSISDDDEWPNEWNELLISKQSFLENLKKKICSQLF